METNETLKTALLQETETAVVKMMEHLQTLPEGDMQNLEQSVMSACLALGRHWLEEVLNHPRRATHAPARREGECGHQQQLVGERPKQLLTLVGKVTVRRPYYQCLVPTDGEEPVSCSHGQAPLDAVWGIESGRTSPGVQRLVSYLGACMTLEEAATIFQRVLPLGMSARQALNRLATGGRSVGQTRR